VLTAPSSSPFLPFSHAQKDEARYHATRFDPTHFIVLQKLIEGMPLASLFPAIDLARTMLSHPDGRSQVSFCYIPLHFTRILLTV